MKAINLNKSASVKFFRQFDYILFGIVLGLSIIGLLTLFSATRVMRSRDGDRIFQMQVIYSVLGYIIMIILSRVDYNALRTLSPYAYIIGVFSLLAVFAFPPIYGSRRWINVGGFTFQSSELMKIVLVIMISFYLSKYEDEPLDKMKNTIKIGSYILLPVGLILLQPDFGTCIITIFILATIIFVSGIKYKYIIWSAAAGAVIIPLAWIFIISKDTTRYNRIINFLNPDRDLSGTGLNVWFSKIAIGSGGFWGKGFLQGTQTQNASVPVKESDFIFSVLGEEFGLIGVMIVVLLVLALILRGMYISANSRDKFGSYMAVGFTALFAVHFFQSIGMSMGMLPVTGIPLPFISSGGSALVMYYAAIGIMLSISMRRKREKHSFIG